MSVPSVLGSVESVYRWMRLFYVRTFVRSIYVRWPATLGLSILRFSFLLISAQAKHCQQDLGFSVLDTTMLYSYMGIASFFSRHAFCKLGDKLDRFLLYQIALVVNGLALVLCSFGQSYAGMVAFFVVYGSMDGGLNGLYPMLVLECVGPDNMRKAFGTYCAFAGIGITAGPPIAGKNVRVLMRVVDAMKETIADVSSLSPSSFALTKG